MVCHIEFVLKFLIYCLLWEISDIFTLIILFYFFRVQSQTEENDIQNRFLCESIVVAGLVCIVASSQMNSYVIWRFASVVFSLNRNANKYSIQYSSLKLVWKWQPKTQHCLSSNNKKEIWKRILLKWQLIALCF